MLAAEETHGAFGDACDVKCDCDGNMKCSPCPEETKCGEPICGACKFDSDCCTGNCDEVNQICKAADSAPGRCILTTILADRLDYIIISQISCFLSNFLLGYRGIAKDRSNRGYMSCLASVSGKCIKLYFHLIK